MKRWLIFSMIVLVIIACLSVWLWRDYKAKQPQTDKPTTVSVTAVTIKTIPLTVKALGQIIAPETIMLKTQADGTVTQIYFKSGQVVKKGQLLLQLDPTAAKAQEAEQFANYTNLKTEYDRYIELAKINKTAVSADMLSQQENAMKAAKAVWQAAVQQVSNMQIKAPFDGIIGIPEQILNQISVDGTPLNEPAQLSIGAYLPSGSAVAILSNPKNMFVQYQIPQEYSSELQIGQAVTIKMSAFPKQIFTGVVKYISPVVYQDNQAYDVVSTIDNPDPSFRSGMNVSVAQTINPNQQILAVPGLSLVPALSGYSVYVIQDSKVQAIPVTIGERYGNLVTILSGLKVGDQVITSGALNVHPGMSVAVEPSE